MQRTTKAKTLATIVLLVAACDPSSGSKAAGSDATSRQTSTVKTAGVGSTKPEPAKPEAPKPEPKPAGSSDAPKSGTKKTEARNVAAFKQVSVSGSFVVEVAVGGAQKVEITGEEALLSKVVTKVQGDRLVVGVDGSLESKEPITVAITTPDLASLQLSGSTDTSVRGVKGDVFALDVGGSSQVKVEGKARDFELTAAGSSQVHAKGLAVENATVNAAGSCQVEVKPATSLKVKAFGSSQIDYWGKPKVDKETSGSASVNAHD